MQAFFLSDNTTLNVRRKTTTAPLATLKIRQLTRIHHHDAYQHGIFVEEEENKLAHSHEIPSSVYQQ